jgi:hypothetical protein
MENNLGTDAMHGISTVSTDGMASQQLDNK